MTTPIANVGLKGRLVGLFLVVGLVPLVTLGLVSRARTREALVDGARTKLEAIREVKTHQVEAPICAPFARRAASPWPGSRASRR